MKSIVDWIVERLKERSTWIGITGLLSAIGIALDPTQVEAIAAAGAGVAGVLAIFTRDRPAGSAGSNGGQ